MVVYVGPSGLVLLLLLLSSFGSSQLHHYRGFNYQALGSVAECIHFTLFGTILPTTKLKVYTLGGL